MAAIDLERGDRAREVLENEIYKESYEFIEQELTRLWKKEENPVVRERLWREQMLLQKVRMRLESVMASGLLEQRARSVPERVMDLVRSGTR